MKKSKLSVQIISEIAICTAIGYVLDLLASSYSSFLPFINGGSIGIAMVCVFIISFRRGPVAGLITGLLMGLLDLMDGFYCITDEAWKTVLQLGFDYVLAYTVCAAAGCFRGLFNKAETKTMQGVWVGVGCLVGGLLKFMCHFLSGVLFWPDGDGNLSAAYSLSYNGGYMFPSIALCVVIMVIIAITYKSLLKVENTKEETIEDSEVKTND